MVALTFSLYTGLRTWVMRWLLGGQSALSKEVDQNVHWKCTFIALLVSHVGNAVSAFIVSFNVTCIHTPVSSSFIQSSQLLLPQPNHILPTRSKSWLPNAPCHVHNIHTSFSMFFPVPLTPFLFLRILYQSSTHKSLCLCSKYIIYPSCIVNSL